MHWHPESSTIQIDIWKIEKTIRLAPDGNLTPLENYFNDLYLNVDRIAFDVDNGTVIDDGCVAGVTEKTIEIQFGGDHNLLKPMDISRAVSLKRKTGYDFGKVLANMIKDQHKEVIADIYEKAQKNNYPPQKIKDLVHIVEETKQN